LADNFNEKERRPEGVSWKKERQAKKRRQKGKLPRRSVVENERQEKVMSLKGIVKLRRQHKILESVIVCATREDVHQLLTRANHG
jgi:hypothetical protein